MAGSGVTSCAHESFRADAQVGRILNGREEADGGELVAFSCEVRVECADCGQAFGWRGVPCGVSINGQPMRSADALELRAWLLSPSELALLEGGLAGLFAP